MSIFKMLPPLILLQTLAELTTSHIKLREHTLFNAKPADINYLLNTYEGMEKFDGVIWLCSIP